MRIVFAEFEIDVQALELTSSGHRIELAPMAVRLLVHLASRSGTLVARSELYEALWPDGAVDRERLVNTYIRQIRGALGERAGDDVFIRTYPRRGYRFLPAVREVPAGTQATHLAEGRVSTRSASPLSALMVGGASAAILALWLGWGHSIAPDLRPVPMAYEMGLELLAQPSPAQRAASVSHFRQAIEQDPELGPAYSGLAEGLFWDGQPLEAEQAARAALARAPKDARAHLVLGVSRLNNAWAWSEAESHLRTAMAVAPEDPNPAVALAFLLVSAGRDEEAVLVLDATVALAPTSAVVTGDLGTMYGWLGRHTEAFDLCSRTVSVAPGATWGHDCALEAARALHQAGDVRLHAEALLKLAGESPAGFFDGPPNTERDYRRFRQHQLDRSEFSDSFQEAVLHAHLGHAVEALAALESAAATKEPGVTALAAHPALRGLRGEPAYEALKTNVLHGSTRLNQVRPR